MDFGDIGARHKGFASSSCDDDPMNVIMTADIIQNRLQIAEDLLIEGIQFVGTVDGYRGNAGVDPV